MWPVMAVDWTSELPGMEKSRLNQPTFSINLYIDKICIASSEIIIIRQLVSITIGEFAINLHDRYIFIDIVQIKEISKFLRLKEKRKSCGELITRT